MSDKTLHLIPLEIDEYETIYNNDNLELRYEVADIEDAEDFVVNIYLRVKTVAGEKNVVFTQILNSRDELDTILNGIVTKEIHEFDPSSIAKLNLNLKGGTFKGEDGYGVELQSLTTNEDGTVISGKLYEVEEDGRAKTTIDFERLNSPATTSVQLCLAFLQARTFSELVELLKSES